MVRHGIQPGTCAGRHGQTAVATPETDYLQPAIRVCWQTHTAGMVNRTSRFPCDKYRQNVSGMELTRTKLGQRTPETTKTLLKRSFRFRRVLYFQRLAGATAREVRSFPVDPWPTLQ